MSYADDPSRAIEMAIHGVVMVRPPHGDCKVCADVAVLLATVRADERAQVLNVVRRTAENTTAMTLDAGTHLGWFAGLVDKALAPGAVDG